MSRAPIFAAILLPLLLPVNELFGQGRDVKVMLRNGEYIEGELLCAQDSSLLVAAEPESGRGKASDPTAGMKRIPTNQVAVVTVEGGSHVLVGMGLGLVVGALAGGIIGAAQTDEPEDLGEALIAYPMEATASTASGAIIGGLVGLGLGGIIGGATSSKEYTVTQKTPGGMAYLSKFAKYPNGEPEFLKSVGK